MMILIHFHPLAWNLPDRACAIDFRPTRLYNLVSAATREDQEPQHLGSNTSGARQHRHETRNLGIGQGGMMPHDALWPLFAQLPGELGRIAEVLVVDVDV